MPEPAGRTFRDAVLAVLLDNRRAFLRFLERRVGSPETAEDVLQEAFARALAKRDTLRDEESAIAWFYRLLRNAVIDLYRHKGASQRALESFGRSHRARQALKKQLMATCGACAVHRCLDCHCRHAEVHRQRAHRRGEPGVPLHHHEALC